MLKCWNPTDKEWPLEREKCDTHRPPRHFTTRIPVDATPGQYFVRVMSGDVEMTTLPITIQPLPVAVQGGRGRGK